MSDRFIIDCYGILDTWKGNGDCRDKLSWSELCDTLNELDELCDENLDEYKLIIHLKNEVKDLEYNLEKYRDKIRQLDELLMDVKR